VIAISLTIISIFAPASSCPVLPASSSAIRITVS